MSFSEHYEETVNIRGEVSKIFAFADNHANLALHMNKSSMMMGGGKMDTILDEGKGQRLGSHIKMEGEVLGMKLYLDEVVTEYTPPFRKVWKTVGSPKLIVIDHYQLGFELRHAGDKTKLKVFIDYNLPAGASKFLGLLFGKFYAKWCVRQMVESISGHKEV